MSHISTKCKQIIYTFIYEIGRDENDLAKHEKIGRVE
jgi:hypothetical protein